MDPRLLDILSSQQQAGFRGIAGSEVHASIRVSEALLNDALTRFLPPQAPVRDVSVHPQSGNRFSVRLSLAKPAFLPPLTVGLTIDRQPQLPGDPTLGLELTGGAGVLRLAAPAIMSFNLLPPGVRMEGNRFVVNIRRLLEEHGQGALLEHAQGLLVTTEEGVLIVTIAATVRG